MKSWWESEGSGDERQVLEQTISDLKDRQKDLSETIDSMRTVTTRHLDSLRDWVESQARAGVEGEVADHMDRARLAWDKAIKSLPRDLSKYERRVAVEDLRETLGNWFELDQSQLRLITGDS